MISGKEMWKGPKLRNLQTCDLVQINLDPVLTSERSDNSIPTDCLGELNEKWKHLAAVCDPTALCAFKCFGGGVGGVGGGEGVTFATNRKAIRYPLISPGE